MSRLASNPALLEAAPWALWTCCCPGAHPPGSASCWLRARTPPRERDPPAVRRWRCAPEQRRGARRRTGGGAPSTAQTRSPNSKGRGGMEGLPDLRGNSQNFESSEDPRARAFTAEGSLGRPGRKWGAVRASRLETPPPHHHHTHPWGRAPGSPQVCAVGPQGSARRRLPLTQVLASQPTFHTESAQMILIKGLSRKGLHLGKNCERLYYHVLLKSRMRGSRWGLFCGV